MVESVFTLALAAQLLVPGWISRAVYRRFFVVETETNYQESFLSYAIMSLLMLAVTWPVFAAMGHDPIGALLTSKDANAFLKEIVGHPVRWLLQLLVAPAVLSVMWAYVERQAWGTDLFTHIGLPPQPRHPNAIQAAIWAHRDKCPMVKITDKKGTVIVGRLGPNSAATVNKGWPDLFVESIYRFVSDGEYVLDDQCSGMYIQGSDIRWIEFFREPSPVPEETIRAEVVPTGPKALSYDKSA